jgi:hypothetical protein
MDQNEMYQLELMMEEYCEKIGVEAVEKVTMWLRSAPDELTTNLEKLKFAQICQMYYSARTEGLSNETLNEASSAIASAICGINS